MSGHKDWGNNERIHRDEYFKGIKSMIENEHLWIMKFLVVVLMYYGNLNENMEWMNSENLAKWTCVVCSEAGVPCRISIVCSEVGVRYQIYVVRNKSGVQCRICVVRSESAFAVEILLCNELVFTIESVLSVANPHSLPKLCCSQRINFAA